MFSELFKLFPQHYVQLENFCTESLSGILIHFGLIDDFINKVLGIKEGCFTLETQKSFPLEDNKHPRPDMFFTNRSIVCIMKNL